MPGPIGVSGNTLRIGAVAVAQAHPIAEAFPVGDLVVVLLRWDSKQEKHGQFPNLAAVSREGAPAWVAELPTTAPGDTFVGVESRDPLVVTSWSGHRCTVDAATGRIVASTFVK
jgi:hypothetical protein